MTGFFQPMRSRTHAIALSDVVEIGGLIKRATGDEYHLIRMRGDTGQVEAYPSEVERLLRRPIQLIPASGTLLNPNVDEDGAFVVRTPLIAWALCLDGEIRPVTPNGVEDGDVGAHFGWFVEMDGGIHSVGDSGRENIFETEDDFMEAVTRWKREDDAARAAGGDA